MWAAFLGSRITVALILGSLICGAIYVQQQRINLLQAQLSKRLAEITALTLQVDQCSTTVKRQNLAIEDLQQRAAAQSDRAVVAAKKVLSALDSQKKAIAADAAGAEEMNAWLNDLFAH